MNKPNWKNYKSELLIHVMDEPNHDEILDIIFDDEISEILAEMENSPKNATELSEKFHITQEELDEKLSKLVMHEFVTKNMDHDDIVYSVDGDKISKLMEDGQNFKNIDDGMAKMDQFLN